MVTIKRDFYGWKLVGILWILDLLNMGFPLYGGSIINTYMLREIPMSRSTFGSAFSLFNLAVGVPSTLIAASIFRFGIRATFTFGSALICLGALWMALMASQPWHYLLGFGVIIGFGWTFVALNNTVGHFYGPVAFPNLIGTMFLLSALACSPAGFVGGRLFDAYRSYRPAFILIIAICLIAIMALAFAKMPKKQQKTAAVSG